MTTRLEYNEPRNGGSRRSEQISPRKSAVAAAERRMEQEPGDAVAIYPPNNSNRTERNINARISKSSKLNPFNPGKNTLDSRKAKPRTSSRTSTSGPGQPLIKDQLHVTPHETVSPPKFYGPGSSRSQRPQDPGNGNGKGKGRADQGDSYERDWELQSRAEDAQRVDDEVVESNEAEWRERKARSKAPRRPEADEITSFSDDDDVQLQPSEVSGPSKPPPKSMRGRNGQLPKTETHMFRSKPEIGRSHVSRAIPVHVEDALLDRSRIPVKVLTIGTGQHIDLEFHNGKSVRLDVKDTCATVLIGQTNFVPIVAFTVKSPAARQLIEASGLRPRGFDSAGIMLMIKFEDLAPAQLKDLHVSVRNKCFSATEKVDRNALQVMYDGEKQYADQAHIVHASSSPDPLAMGNAAPAPPTKVYGKRKAMLSRHHRKLSMSEEPEIVEQPRPTESTRPTRRSTRHSAASANSITDYGTITHTSRPLCKKSDDPTKLLFRYPLTGRGGISVTAGDRDRVGLHEYLNDTLIEFGLKRIFAEITEAQQSRIHYFNSFFYKKLSMSKKRRAELDEGNVDSNAWEGYEAVKKWTQKGKIDVFDKDLIVIPINEHLHWYLAVIYNPKGILEEPVDAQTNAETPIDIDEAPVTRRSSVISKATASFHNLFQKVIPSAAQSKPERIEPSVASPAKPSTEPIEILEEPEGENRGSGQPDLVTQSTPPPVERESSPGIPLDTRTTRRRNKSATPEIAVSSLRPLPTRKPPAVPKRIWGDKRAWILVFDSLGGNHPAVGKKLARWLEYEARHKREVDHRLTPAEHFDVRNTLLQTNSVDCGIYVLNTAERIMRKPEVVIKFIEDSPSIVDATGDHRRRRDSVWGAQDVSAKREDWLGIIDSLAHQYAEVLAQAGPEESDPAEGPDDFEFASLAEERAEAAEAEAVAGGWSEAQSACVSEAEALKSPTSPSDADLGQHVSQLSIQPPAVLEPTPLERAASPAVILRDRSGLSVTPVDSSASSPPPPSPPPPERQERPLVGAGLARYLSSASLPGKDLSAGWSSAPPRALAISEGPQAVDDQEMAEEPEVPEQPAEEPERAEEPETVEVPMEVSLTETPEVLGVPDASESPELPEVPEFEVQSEDPELPETLVLPEAIQLPVLNQPPDVLQPSISQRLSRAASVEPMLTPNRAKRQKHAPPASPLLAPTTLAPTGERRKKQKQQEQPNKRRKKEVHRVKGTSAEQAINIDSDDD